MHLKKRKKKSIQTQKLKETGSCSESEGRNGELLFSGHSVSALCKESLLYCTLTVSLKGRFHVMYFYHHNKNNKIFWEILSNRRQIKEFAIKKKNWSQNILARQRKGQKQSNTKGNYAPCVSPVVEAWPMPFHWSFIISCGRYYHLPFTEEKTEAQRKWVKLGHPTAKCRNLDLNPALTASKAHVLPAPSRVSPLRMLLS